jgi:hypothetical protein
MAPQSKVVPGYLEKVENRIFNTNNGKNKVANTPTKHRSWKYGNYP